MEHSPFQQDKEKERANGDTAKRLTKEFNLCVSHQAYHYQGNFYGQLDRHSYPLVLFDLYGYVVIDSERELSIKADLTETVHIPDGISKMRGYVKYPFEPKSIKNYQEQVKKEQIHRKISPRLRKLQKEKNKIEQQLLDNEKIIGFGVEIFRESLHTQLKIINTQLTL